VGGECAQYGEAAYAGVGVLLRGFVIGGALLGEGNGG
jgi:hypothetical protein